MPAVMPRFPDQKSVRFVVTVDGCAATCCASYNIEAIISKLALMAEMTLTLRLMVAVWKARTVHTILRDPRNRYATPIRQTGLPGTIQSEDSVRFR